MMVLMIVFIAYLVYVSYCKPVCLCFRGRQHNRFFATFISIFVPVLGSVPTLVMASKYERRVGGIAPNMNGEALRYSIIGLQLLSVFMLFLPFFKQDGIYVNGVNLIFGLSADGEWIFNPFKFFIYLIIAPFISAIVSSFDIKYNIRNILSYSTSLLCCLTVFIIAMFSAEVANFTIGVVTWIYLATHVTIMLLSIFSIVKVRNEFLFNLEEVEKAELIAYQKSMAKKTEVEKIPADSYKCAKCGSLVIKGTFCSCRKKNADTLDKIMVEQNKKDTSDFCVYCRRPLNPGEVCNCAGEGFGITIKPEQFDGRKCRYCGQVLVGDSVCVCEKIMNKSDPVSVSDADNVGQTYSDDSENISDTHISDEMAELEDKINAKFTDIKTNYIKQPEHDD